MPSTQISKISSNGQRIVSVSEEVQKSLSLVSVELVSSKRLTREQAMILQPVLEDDLAGIDPGIAIEAIRRHRFASPYWPAISDLMKHVETIEAERKADPANFSAKHWKNLIAWASKLENEWQQDWGPEPGQPGCLVPAELMEDHHADR